MKGAGALRKPVQTTTLNMTNTNVPTGSWTTLLAKASNNVGCSAIEVFAPDGSVLQIATGDAGSEKALPYTILPGGSNLMLPMEIPAGVRISLQAIDTGVTAGYFVLNQFA